MTARPMTPTRRRPPECCNMVAVKSALWVLLLLGCPLAKLRLVHANTKYRTAFEIPLALAPQRDASPPVRNARASASRTAPSAPPSKTRADSCSSHDWRSRCGNLTSTDLDSTDLNTTDLNT